MSKRTFFVTGGTGFLGRHLLERIAAGDNKVYALKRKTSKLAESLKALPIEWIEGDLENPELMGIEDRARLQEEVTEIVHAAALYDISAKKEELYWANIVGTHHVMHLAGELPHLKGIHHISTMAVAGDYPGVFTEGMFSEGQSFPDDYAATKFASEACIRSARTDVPRFIYRLGILVGDSRTGEIPKIDGPYFLMRAIHKQKLLAACLRRLHAVPLPFNERTRTYLVPVNSAADAIAEVLEKGRNLPPKPIRTYHVMGEPGGVAIRSLLRRTLRSSGIEAKVLAVPEVAFVPWAAEKLSIPRETLHYMYSPCQFDTKRLHADFPDIRFPRFEEYWDTIYNYASKNLFEQVAP